MMIGDSMVEYEIPFVCLIFTILISVVFFTKEKVNLEENFYFRNVLLFTLFVNFSNFISHYLAHLYLVDGVDSWYAPVFATINKLGSLGIVAITFNVMSYIFYISFENYRKNFHFFKVFNRIVLAIEAVFVFFLEFDVYKVGAITSGKGASVIFTFSIVFLNLLLALIVSLINIKKYDKRYNSIYIIIPLIIVLGIFVMFHPEFNIYDLILCLLCYLMYFTIENPDMKMIEQLNTAKDTAEKANRAKSDFLSSMSHEIRTPLNAIVGFSECILNENDLESAKSDAMDIIMASQNLLEIVNGILDISKIEADKMEIVESEYSLKENLDSLVKLTIPRIGEKPIEFKTKFAPDIPATLYGDSAKVKQIIMNILTNAVKYTERGIIAFEVNCINKDNVCSLVFSVEDTGRGIKEDKLDTIFNKFERLEEDRNTTLEGTGLGLAITKRLVEMMGGKIVVQSKYGAGSKFTVYLKQEIRNTPIKQEKTYKVTVANANFSNKKVLVVDDNKINLKVATRMLEPFKVVIEECMSGEECLQKVHDGAIYDLILMDDMMPRITGTETFHELEKIENFKTPVVVLTANAIEGMREKYLEEGFVDYLAKPIDKLELERVLGTFLAHTNKEEKEELFEPLPEDLFDINIPLNKGDE